MFAVFQSKCDGCRACMDECPADAIIMKHGKAHIDTTACVECSARQSVCHNEAIAKTG